MDEDSKKEASTIKRIAEQWRKSLEGVKEVEFIDDQDEKSELERFLSRLTNELSPPQNNLNECSRSRSFFPSFLHDHEYQVAQRLKKQLLAEYHGVFLEDIFPGIEIETDDGPCFNIQSQEKVVFNVFSQNQTRNKILSDLKLIYGIGKVKEQKLKVEGYRSIEDLVDHPRFGSTASDFLIPFIEKDYNTIVKQVIDCYWVSSSHPLFFYSSGFFQKENFAIIDIETLGLFSRPIILFGIAKVRDSSIEVNQLLLRDVEEEPAALRVVQNLLDEETIFISYNGRSFDVPYINQRLAFYGINPSFNNLHFDLLHFARRAWKDLVPNCQLTTLEEHLLNIHRENDVPSALIPDFYDTYRQENNIGPLVPIIKHNKQDLMSLAYLFSKLQEEWEND
ncbi:MAG: exonuclease [Candidatus Heimdallarchaeota archaeon]|nr:exonuclease [Candidatus Heimdallarchaeota archaeon]